MARKLREGDFGYVLSNEPFAKVLTSQPT